jgi:GT2 family glycosyltransferase
MNPSVAIVILNYNTRGQLQEFLPGVLATDYDNFQVVVADNGSRDGSADFIEAHYPEVQLIRFEQNHGYAGGYNEALKQVRADFYVLLNSDVEVPADWLRPLVQCAERHADLAAVQPFILDQKQKDRYEYAGAAGGWIDRFGYPFCRGRLFDNLESAAIAFNEAPVFWASGAALFIRASDFHAIGGFDARFFAHMEEIDLCWRLQLAGKTVYSCPESRVYHVGGGTLKKQSPFKTFLNFRNGLLLLEKNLPAATRRRTILLRMCLDGIAAIKFLLAGQLADFAAVFRAHVYFHRNRRKFRPEQLVSRSPDSLHGYYNRSIVWQYFARKVKRFSDLPGVS